MKPFLLFVTVFFSLASCAMEKPQKDTTFHCDPKESTCCICTEDFKKNGKYTQLPCNHVIHFECYGKLNSSPQGRSCPMCRHSLTPEIRKKLAAKPSGDINTTSGLLRFLKPSWWTASKDQKNTEPCDNETLEKALLQISQLQMQLTQRTGALNSLNLSHQQLMIRNSTLELTVNKHQEALKNTIDNHHRWKKRLMTCSSLALGACTGFIAYKYLTDNSKVSGIAAGIGSWAISEYISKRQLAKWHTNEHAEVMRLV